MSNLKVGEEAGESLKRLETMRVKKMLITKSYQILKDGDPKELL